MKNNKGFTLIELLAVIIILAIIALITTPIILNVVNKARLDAAKDKAWGTMDAVKVAYAQDQADNETLVSFPLVVTFDGLQPGVVGITEVKMSGQKPEGGTVTMQEDGTFTCNKLKFGSYCCNSDGNTMNCDPDNCNEPDKK